MHFYFGVIALGFLAASVQAQEGAEQLDDNMDNNDPAPELSMRALPLTVRTTFLNTLLGRSGLCTPDAWPAIGKTGFCAGTYDLDSKCSDLEISAAANDCSHVDGNWCCYDPSSATAATQHTSAPYTTAHISSTSTFSYSVAPTTTVGTPATPPTTSPSPVTAIYGTTTSAQTSSTVSPPLTSTPAYSYSSRFGGYFNAFSGAPTRSHKFRIDRFNVMPANVKSTMAPEIVTSTAAKLNLPGRINSTTFSFHNKSPAHFLFERPR